MRYQTARRRAVVAVMAFALASVGCSSTESSDPLAVELTHPQGRGTIVFAATGPAADEGIICTAGSMSVDRLESMDGVEISDDDWADMFDDAMASESIAEQNVYQTWTCDEDAGSFTLRHHNRIDFANFEFEGRQDVGSWEITEGTDTMEGLTGSGDVILDWDAEAVVHSGEVAPG